MDLSIIIVSWNTAELTEKCLESVFSNPPNRDYEVWVVDNASNDNSVERIRKRFPNVLIIENPQNIGFGRANNLAMDRASGKYIGLLNSDTVVYPGTFTNLIDFMNDHPRAGACGSHYKNPDGSLQTSCYPFPTLFREIWRLLHLDKILTYGVYQMSGWDLEEPREVDVLQGASLLLRKEALEKVGLFDPAYFMYTEEVDLCFRLKKAGWSLFWVPTSIIKHFGGQSTRQAASDMFIRLYQSKLIFFRKQYGNFSAWGYKAILLITTIIRLVISPLAWLLAPKERKRIPGIISNYIRLLSELKGM